MCLLLTLSCSVCWSVFALPSPAEALHPGERESVGNGALWCTVGQRSPRGGGTLGDGGERGLEKTEHHCSLQRAQATVCKGLGPGGHWKRRNGLFGDLSLKIRR